MSHFSSTSFFSSSSSSSFSSSSSPFSISYSSPSSSTWANYNFLFTAHCWKVTILFFMIINTTMFKLMATAQCWNVTIMISYSSSFSTSLWSRSMCSRLYGCLCICLSLCLTNSDVMSVDVHLTVWLATPAFPFPLCPETRGAGGGWWWRHGKSYLSPIDCLPNRVFSNTIFSQF